MARSNDKEILQCLALAYFAEHPYHSDKTHQVNWEDVFQPYVAKEDFVLLDGTEVRRDSVMERDAFPLLPRPDIIRKRRQGELAASIERVYGKYLSRHFNYTLAVKNFSLKVNTNKKGKKSVVIPPKLKIAYKVAESFVHTSLVDNLGDYQFLDQDDEFTSRIKDDSLKRIHEIFELGGNYELLSPVDMFCVKRNMKERVQKEYETHIIDATEDTILSNMSFGDNGRHTYRTIAGKHFHSRDCVGISLKFPKSIEGKKYTKIIGSTTVAPHLRGFVDPYGKLIGEMLNKNVNIETLLNKAITINFSQFRVDSALSSWEYPVTFNYNNIVDSEVKEPLYKTKLKFLLLTWGNAGFNGQWLIGGQKTTWVSGIGVGSAEKVMFQYREYHTIVEELVKVRREVFQRMFPIKAVDPKKMGDYKLAMDQLETKQILVNAKMKAVDKFMKNNSTRYEYRLRVIQELTKRIKRNYNKVNEKYIHQHFQASQLAYFLFRAENKVNGFLKRRIFLSIFGMLNKSGYKIFETNGGKTEMRNYIKKQFTKKGKQVEAYYNAAPYVLLS